FHVCLLASKIDVESAAATGLRWKEWFQQPGECGEVAGLNQNLARPHEFGDDAFTTHHAAKETRGSFAQSVLRRAFPRNEVPRVNNVALARLQHPAMDCAKRRDEQKPLPLHEQHE